MKRILFLILISISVIKANQINVVNNTGADLELMWLNIIDKDINLTDIPQTKLPANKTTRLTYSDKANGIYLGTQNFSGIKSSSNDDAIRNCGNMNAVNSVLGFKVEDGATYTVYPACNPNNHTLYLKIAKL